MIGPAQFNLRHLDALVAVGQLGSISAAAMAVNLSQPAATQGISKLERALGHRLFDRQTAGVQPTEAGGLMLRRAERAIGMLVDAARIVRRSARLPALAHAERLVSMIQLRAFHAVVRNASYAAAAREIGLSQPSVYRSARELELILQVPLLVRVGKSVRATEPAQRLARAVSLVMAELQAGLDELGVLEGKGAGRLTIGSLPLPRSALLPEALAAFSRGHPDAIVSIVEGPYFELVASLRDGSIDLLLGALRDPSAASDLEQTLLFKDDLYVVARADHPLTRQTTPTHENFAAYPWIVGPAGAPMRGVWEAMFAHRIKPKARIECGSILTIRGMLLNGDWLAFMSRDQFALEQRAGLLTALGGPVPKSRRDIGLATRADWRPTATQESFVAIVREVALRRSLEN